MNAIAFRKFESSAMPAIQTPTAPSVPSSGPASATCASFHAFFGICFIPTKAPRNGMKSGAEAGTPWRRSSSTWPISWTKISATRPSPNHQPPSSA